MSSINGRGLSVWTRILKLDEQTWLGMVEDSLFVGDDAGPKRLLNDDHPLGLLPCLERPYDEVVAEIAEREQELSLPPGELAGRIPLHLVPGVAIETHMNYWVERALDWLDAVVPEALASRALRTIALSDWASQSSRHRARHMLSQRGLGQ